MILLSMRVIYRLQGECSPATTVSTDWNLETKNGGVDDTICYIDDKMCRTVSERTGVTVVQIRP